MVSLIGYQLSFFFKSTDFDRDARYDGMLRVDCDPSLVTSKSLDGDDLNWASNGIMLWLLRQHFARSET